ncbi:hypothetical protein OCU04_008002 [Sclerotinia nivalis]|uniref:Uncharacterized protein n=1 Tax=Sclerotinia nivalis TaxID=352851 RepID=A0A9X0AI38_9HELO|nr:hypothetical protein OCU04_008002 [Sclerotinia nivalis]
MGLGEDIKGFGESEMQQGGNNGNNVGNNMENNMGNSMGNNMGNNSNGMGGSTKDTMVDSGMFSHLATLCSLDSDISFA